MRCLRAYPPSRPQAAVIVVRSLRDRTAGSRSEPTTLGRSGVTLTEILMSMLIMSIGVVSLATLFPISVLRSIQATQLTNATLLRYNAEAMIDTFPQLVHDPDGDTNTTEHFRIPRERRYIVDPLGATTLFGDYGGTPPFHAFFGHDGANNPSNGNGGRPLLRRFDGGFSANPDIATLPDSFEAVTGGVPTSATTTTLTMPADVALADVPVGTARATVFDTTERFSHVRTITAINGQQMTVSPALPSGFTNIGRVEIDYPWRNYTWLLTVRKTGSGSANVDVVVFFRRHFDIADERVYPARFTRGSNVVTIGIPVGTEPFLKKGGYVFDVANARWYRIQDFSVGGGQVTITLEQEAVDTAAEDANLNGQLDGGEDLNNNNVLDGGAILMRGIVDVFTIGTK